MMTHSERNSMVKALHELPGLTRVDITYFVRASLTAVAVPPPPLSSNGPEIKRHIGTAGPSCDSSHHGYEGAR